MNLAERGNPNAQSIAGFLPMNGIGVRKNEANVVWHLWTAASKGVTSAMNNYAICLLQGSGCPQSWGDAVMWFERASRLGNTAAKVNLAHCALIGRARADVVQLLREACKDDDPHAFLTTGICSYQAIWWFSPEQQKSRRESECCKAPGKFPCIRCNGLVGTLHCEVVQETLDGVCMNLPHKFTVGSKEGDTRPT